MRYTSLAMILSGVILAVAETSADPDGASTLIVPRDQTLVYPGDAGAVVWTQEQVDDLESPNLEFPSLARFQDHWYVSLREGLRHGNHISGRGRLLRSSDGDNWEAVALFESETGDVRDPRLSVTPDGQLMINASIYYIPEAAPLETVDGVEVARRSVTWLSSDGKNWSGPHACPTGINTWRWDAAWDETHAYSIGYSGKDSKGTLYRSADGKVWEVVAENIFPGGGFNEAALSFGHDDTLYVLLRGGAPGVGQDATLGMAAPPYVDWEWKSLEVVWPDTGLRRPFHTTSARNLGGPALITLEDGRLLGAARARGGAGINKIFLVDPGQATMTYLIDVQGGSYPGLVEHEGEIWFTYVVRGHQGPVYLGWARIAGRTSLEDLMEMAEAATAGPDSGFGRKYQEQLAQWITPEEVLTSEAWQDGLEQSLANYQSAQRLRAEAEQLLRDGRELPVWDGFGQRARESLAQACDHLATGLRNDTASSEEIVGQVETVEDRLAVVTTMLQWREVAQSADELAQSKLGIAGEGWQGLLQNQLKRKLDRVRDTLSRPDAARESLSKELADLRRTLGEYTEVEFSPDLSVVDLSGVTGPMKVREPGASNPGLRFNTRLQNGALTLMNVPVLAFSERQSVVDFGNPSAIAELQDQITISLWGYPENTEESYRTLLIKGDGHSGHNGLFLRHGRTLANDNAVSMGVFGYDEPHDPFIQSFRPRDPAAFDHQWHHYAWTFDGNEFVLYIDGEPVAREEKSGQIDISEGNLTAGRNREPWRGHIRDVRIRNLALSGDQIVAEMNSIPSSTEPDLVGYWPLDEGEGDVARDLSSGANHGVIRNPEWVEAPALSGYAISGPFRFADQAEIAGVSISWREDQSDPDPAGARVWAGISPSPDELPGVWVETASGERLPGFNGVSDNTECFLWIREELWSTDKTKRPVIEDLRLVIE